MVTLPQINGLSAAETATMEEAKKSMDSEPGSYQVQAWIALIISVCIACGVSMLCSLMEAALLSLAPSQLAKIRRRSVNIGKICQKLKHEIDRPIALILILNTAAHTIGAAVAGAAFDHLFGQSWLWVFTLGLTLIMVQYTEILPKTLGVRFNENIMFFAAPILDKGVIILHPLILLVHFINRPFEKDNKKNSNNTADEISALAALARSTQQINLQQERIIRVVPQLSELTVEEVMLPLENVSFIPSDKSISDAINFTTKDFHTRYPVCEPGNPDSVLGYVNFKELVASNRTNPEKTKLTDLIRPILFVTVDDCLDDVLQKFSSHYCHMAIARDEHNKVKGMLTLEDIIEELIGDLDDEFDPLPRTFYSPAEGYYVVGGGTPMTILAREAMLDIPHKREPLALWFEEEYDKPLKVGITYQFNNAEFCVRKIRRGRVLEFNVKRLSPSTTPLE